MLEKWQLHQRQTLPLEVKMELSQKKIREWYDHWNGEVYVAFSGGKDSTVLLHLTRSILPDVHAVFSDTGLEYPEIKEFVKSIPNVHIVRPKKSFKQVIDEYGYPVVSKKIAYFVSQLQNPTEKNIESRHLRLTGYTSTGNYCPTLKLPKKWHKLIDAPFKVSDRCCDYTKKNPLKEYAKKSGKKAIVGVMAEESSRREHQYLQHGCNIYRDSDPISSPMAFWTEQDVLRYLRDYNVPYASVYGDIVEDENGKLSTTGEKRTGCMFCMFGAHLEKGENRFQRMKRTHPQLWDYCINKLGLREVLDFIEVKYE